jgi:hypothetical protein
MALFTITNNGGNLTEFSVSAITGNGCALADLSPYSASLWHNGFGSYPVIGDIIYTTSTGATKAVSIGGVFNDSHLQMGNLEYLKTDASGIMVALRCEA